MSGPEQDPTICVKVNDQPLRMMVDSGAAFTCVQPKDATHLPLSGKFVRTIGFEGIRQLIPTTITTELCYKNQKVTIPILVSEHTPIALLGRDALCRLHCTIKCTPDGCLVEVPVDIGHQLVMTTETDASSVFWIGNLSQELLEPARVWDKFITANMPDAKLPEYPHHCTLQYFKDAAGSNPDEWLTHQPKQVLLNSDWIVLGPQGVAMKINSNDYLNREHNIKNSIPHVTLRIAESYEQKHVGAMMMESEKVSFTPLKENMAIWRSEDHRFMKIAILSHGLGQPQTVQMTNESVFSMTTDPADMREEMLEKVPKCVWSQHTQTLGL